MSGEGQRPKIVSVTELNNLVKGKLDTDPFLTSVAVEGEISGWKINGTGHAYFVLKDAAARVSCALFVFRRRSLGFLPKDGDKIILLGRATLYAPNGSYQLVAETLFPCGTGDLYVLFEKLKTKLAAEGLFDQSHKHPLPKLPKAVGVITSPTGAAVRDIIRVARNRHPGIKIYLYPASVQGEGAADDLVRGLKFFNRSRLADVLIIGRGGGSYEDLWCFNEEKLVRAVAASKVPVISAVGHETDFTLCDFAADLRAATPSNGAELAVPDLGVNIGRLEQLQNRLSYCWRNIFLNAETQWGNGNNAMEDAFSQILERAEQRFLLATAGLEQLSPLKVLLRGYSVTISKGKVVKTIEAVQRDDRLETCLGDGKIISVVQEVKNG